MPFSAARSVRAPASNATRIVVARVPGIAIRWMGSPLAAVLVVISAMSLSTIPAAGFVLRSAGVSSDVRVRAAA